jgi:hypothetical protein
VITPWEQPPAGWPDGEPWPPVPWPPPEPPQVVAYCAPGRQFLTALLLLMRGERVRRVEETPLMAGRTDVIVVPDMTTPADWAGPRSGGLAGETEES